MVGLLLLEDLLIELEKMVRKIRFGVVIATVATIAIFTQPISHLRLIQHVHVVVLLLNCGKSETAKENVYDLTSFEYGVGYDSNGKEFYFDKEDFELIKGYCWVVHITKQKRKDGTIREKITVSANGKYHNGKRKAVLLHRLVMGLYDTEFCNNEVDHIDRNPLNNQKSNLRICTNQQNSFNRGIRNNNTTGIIGVRKTYNNKFIATIGYNYKKQYLGTYETLLDAAIAYNEKALELYGEFANLNDLENIKNSYPCDGR